jgi:hypothetical protein
MRRWAPLWEPPSRLLIRGPDAADARPVTLVGWIDSSGARDLVGQSHSRIHRHGATA